MTQHTDPTAPDWAPTRERQRELLWAMICRIDNVLRIAKQERRARRGGTGRCSPPTSADRRCRQASVVLTLAAIDLAVAAWLLWYGRVRERRNRAGVLIVGAMLVLSGVALTGVDLTRSEPATRPPVPAPSTIPATPTSTSA
jgi:hypothetical protein